MLIKMLIDHRCLKTFVEINIRYSKQNTRRAYIWHLLILCLNKAEALFFILSCTLADQNKN